MSWVPPLVSGWHSVKNSCVHSFSIHLIWLGWGEWWAQWAAPRQWTWLSPFVFHVVQNKAYDLFGANFVSFVQQSSCSNFTHPWPPLQTAFFHGTHFDHGNAKYHQWVISCRSCNANLSDFLLIIRYVLWLEDKHSDLIVCQGNLSVLCTTGLHQEHDC